MAKAGSLAEHSCPRKDLLVRLTDDILNTPARPDMDISPNSAFQLRKPEDAAHLGPSLLNQGIIE